MHQTHVALKREIENVPRNSRGRRMYTRQLRFAVCAFVEPLLKEKSVNVLTAELGLSQPMLCRWLKRKKDSTNVIREVVLKPEAAMVKTESVIALRFPNGIIVEGLSVEDVRTLVSSVS